MLELAQALPRLRRQVTVDLGRPELDEARVLACAVRLLDVGRGWAPVDVLGNTPAVARRSYIDPRVFDRYLSGATIAAEGIATAAQTVGRGRTRRRIERAVIDLLADG